MLQTLLGNTYPDAQLEQVCVLAGRGHGCVLKYMQVCRGAARGAADAAGQHLP